MQTTNAIAHRFFLIPALACAGALGLAAAPAIFAGVSAGGPVLCFSDLAGGPKTGNSDTSLGQPAGQDGAIVTLWGRNLGGSPARSQVFANGAEARIYLWTNATAPADLFTRHQMQMVSFQISRAARDGPGGIRLVVNGRKSNPLPFNVQAGRIFFVKTNGHAAASGDWASPFPTIPQAVGKMAPGDIVYVCDGVNQVVADSYGAAVNLGSDGEPGKPKALVAYPGAQCLIGATNVERGFGHWVSGQGHTADYWTIAKFNVTAGIIPVLLGSGYRVVGNYVTAPTASAAEGAIEGSGSDLFVLGNELTQVGRPGCSKLYHPIYISSARASSGPRRPPEANRELAWNYLHDNNAIRGINIYSERPSTAYMSGHQVHDNFIIDQVSDGLLVGQYVTGENWIYNNVVVRAGLGPDPDPRESEASSHFGVSIDAGHETFTNTVIHFCHNTLYGCGWSGARPGSSGAVHLVHLNRYTLHFRNNVIVSTGEPYISGWSDKAIPPGPAHNLWFGTGPPPAWDVAAIGADPRFLDPAHDNFRLQPGSPAVDAGLDAGIRADFDGAPRPQGPRPDLGAYEAPAPP